MRILIHILLSTALIPAPVLAKTGTGSGKDCKTSLIPAEQISLQQTAERILGGYAPYDKRPFLLTSLDEAKDSGVYLGSDQTGERFILKVNPLEDAINDYYALKLLKQIEPSLRTRVRIIDSVLLTPKKPKSIDLSTKVIQKNAYIQGRPLAEVLVDPDVPHLRKVKLHRIYSEWLKELATALRKSGFELDTAPPTGNFYKKHQALLKDNPEFLKLQPPLLKGIKAWRDEFKSPAEIEAEWKFLPPLLRGPFKKLIALPDEDLMILIKSDNLMVNESDEMTLFDPF